jgi:hypothetical protein
MISALLYHHLNNIGLNRLHNKIRGPAKAIDSLLGGARHGPHLRRIGEQIGESPC